MKKLIRYLRWRLAQWHKKRFQKLMSKYLGANYYYRYVKSNLSSVYGMSVRDMYPTESMIKPGYEYYYADTDSIK